MKTSWCRYDDKRCEPVIKVSARKQKHRPRVFSCSVYEGITRVCVAWLTVPHMLPLWANITLKFNFFEARKRKEKFEVAYQPDGVLYGCRLGQGSWGNQWEQREQCKKYWSLKVLISNDRENEREREREEDFDWTSRILYIRTTYHSLLTLLPWRWSRRCLGNLVNDLSRVLHSARCQTKVSIVRNVDPVKCSFPTELWSAEIVTLTERVLLISVLYLSTITIFSTLKMEAVDAFETLVTLRCFIYP